jgi:hypothetical protein
MVELQVMTGKGHREISFELYGDQQIGICEDVMQ